MLAVVGLAVFLFGAFVHYWYVMRNRTVACFELPYSPDAELHSSLIWWPVGVRCEYGSGSELIIVESDWTMTIVLLVGISLVVTALAIWIASTRSATEGKK